MNKELIDRAWRVLPAEFKEVVQEEYAIISKELSHRDTDAEDYSAWNYAKMTFEELFGSKCLPDEEKSQPKFHKGDRVKVITDCWKDKVYTVTDVKEIYPQFSYMLSCSPTAWFTESTLEPYTEEPQPAEPKFMCGDKAVLKGYVCTIIGRVFGPQGKLVGYKIESSQIHGNMTVPESYLEPYTEPSNEESAVLRADSVKESRIADEESHLRNLSQEIANCDKQFDNIIKDSPSKERRLNIAKDFVSVLLGRLNYDPFVAQINCCCSNGEDVNPYINIARIALSAADALITESKKGETI